MVAKALLANTTSTSLSSQPSQAKGGLGMETQTPADNTDKKKTPPAGFQKKKEKISKHNVIKCHSGGSSHLSFRTAKKNKKNKELVIISLPFSPRTHSQSLYIPRKKLSGASQIKVISSFLPVTNVPDALISDDSQKKKRNKRLHTLFYHPHTLPARSPNLGSEREGERVLRGERGRARGRRGSRGGGRSRGAGGVGAGVGDAGLLGPAETGGGGAGVEDDELALEEDVADDGEADAVVALDAAEALAARGGRVVDVRAGHGALLAVDDEREGGQIGGAVEDVAAVVGAVLGARDLLVVGRDNVAGQVEQGGAGVSDGVDGGGLGGAVADGVGGGLELPEAVGGVDIDVDDLTGVLAVVDVTQVVRTGLTLLQGDGEELLGKGVANSVEESLLGLGLDGVDGAEGQAEQAIVVGVLGEGSGHGGGGLDGLRGGSDAADDDLVGVDLAGRTRAITVGDVPRGTGLLGARLGGIVDGVAGLLALGHKGGEDPTARLLA